MKRDGLTVPAERIDERGVGGPKRILGADVHPDCHPPIRITAPGDPDHVVQREVPRVVERAGGALGAAHPQRGRVSPDRAEATRA